MGRHVPVVAALLLVACGWHGPQALQTWPGIDQNDDVVALDKAAWKLVAVQALQTDKTDDGRLHVKFELANLSSIDLAVQVQTLFRDTTGMLTGDETAFEMVVLPGGGSKLYEATSLKTTAASFTVQVKTP